MPITQDRLINLIDIADSFRKNLDDINSSSFLEDIYNAANNPDLVKEMVSNFKLYLNQKCIPNYEQTQILTREQEHFRFSAKRNVNFKNAMTRVRALRLSRAMDLDEIAEAEALLSETPTDDGTGTRCVRCHRNEVTNNECAGCGFTQPEAA